MEVPVIWQVRNMKQRTCQLIWLEQIWTRNYLPFSNLNKLTVENSFCKCSDNISVHIKTATEPNTSYKVLELATDQN